MAKKRKTKSRKKKSFSFKKRLLWALSIIILIGTFFAKDISIGYYDKLEGLSKASLKTATHDLIRDHEYLNFDEKTTARYWWDNYFIKTDWHPDGYYWDMYSNEQHSTYTASNVQNREHCMPRSWWGKRDKYSSYDANGDLHNLFPSDYAANAAKSNLPLGEVGISQFENGSSKVGRNTYPKGYQGQVFEPADEYKGDFARIYFYMVTCYEDYAYNWRNDATKSMLQKGTYPSFQPWAIEMLLKWHRNDPVSEKERDRNKQVYRIQNNRNPFVDNPELAEYIWGNMSDKPFHLPKGKTSGKEPQIEDEVLKFINKTSYWAKSLKEKIK